MTIKITHDGRIKAMGILIILIALFFNPYVITYFFTIDGQIQSFRHVTLIILFEITLFIIGIILYKIPNYWREVLLLLLSFFILTVLVEISTRTYLCNFADYTIQSKYLLYGQCGITSLYEPHHYLNYRGVPNYKSPDGLNMHNSYGFRGPEISIPKPKGVYRIVMIGGSTTYDVDIKDWRNDSARQLEKNLRKLYLYDNIEVVNAGLNSWNSWESLINFEFNILDLEPDMIIIYDSINDVHARLVNPQYYKGDNSGRRKRWEEPTIPLMYRLTFVRLFTGINPSGLDIFVDAKTSLAGIQNEGQNKVLNGTPFETLQKNPPIYFERNIRNMLAIAKEHNISVLLSTVAYANNTNDFFGTRHYQYGLQEQNKLLKNISRSHQIPVYDFYAEMPMDKKFATDGRHFNEQGAALRGKLFAQYILSNKLIDDDLRTIKANND